MSNLLLLGAGGYTATGATFADVVLQVGNDNAADTTTTFTDESNSAHTPTAVGNVQYDTAQAPTGMTSSILFDGTGDYITYPDHANWALGTGDFTIEQWVRFATLTGRQFLYAPYNGTGSVSFYSEKNSANKIRAGFSTNGADPGSANDIVSTNTVSADTWYHIAYVRNGTAFKLWIDGAEKGSFTSSASIFDSSAPLAIGAFGNLGSLEMNGWICSTRITKGVARYTAAFTPPSLPLPTS